MRLRLWDTFTDMEALRREIDSLFSEFVPGAGPIQVGRTCFRTAAAPSLNLSEDADHVYVEMLAPGVDPAKLDVNILNGTLRVSGEKPALCEEIKKEAFHRRERGAGTFTRTVTLPAKVNQDKAKAEFKNGVLLLTLPKTEEAKPKQITVDIN